MFYVIEISTGDSSIAGRAVYESETLNAATALFYQKLANAMKSDLFTSELCMVIDAQGAVYRSEKYEKTIAEA